MGKKKRRKRRSGASRADSTQGEQASRPTTPARPRLDRKRPGSRTPAGRRTGPRFLILFPVSIIAYLQTVTHEFTYDDIHIVRDNPQIISLANIPELFRSNYWGHSDQFRDQSLYRPFTMTTYALNHALHGMNPMGFHAVNVLLHALAVLVLFRLVGHLFQRQALAWAAALWFAVHPIHTEVVAAVVGRAELLSFLGAATCVWAYFMAHAAAGRERPGEMAGWLCCSLLAYLVAMFSKESGAIAPAFIVLSEIVLAGRRWLLRARPAAVATFAAYGGALGLYLLMRSAAAEPRVVALAFEDMGARTRILTALKVCVQYVGLLLFPAQLSADYAEGSTLLATGFDDPYVWGAIALMAAGLVFLVWSWRRLPAAAWGLLLFLMSLFPVSNLPFAIGVIKAERLLYTPSAGFLVAVAAGLFYLLDYRGSRPVLWATVYTIGGLLLLQTWIRNLDWRNNYTLATATLRTSPSSLTFNTILGNWYREHGRNDLARFYLSRVQGRGADKSVSYYNLGNIALDEGKHEEAVRLYRQVLEVESSHTGALNNLGRALTALGDYRGAVEAYRRVLEVSPNHPGAYVNLMDLYMRLNNLEQALALADRALRLFPNEEAVQWNAGAVYRRAGRPQQAEAAFQRATRLNPEIAVQRDVKKSFE